MARHLYHDSRETALQEDRRAFHKQHDIVLIDLYWSFIASISYLFPVRGGPALGKDRGAAAVPAKAGTQLSAARAADHWIPTLRRESGFTSFLLVARRGC